MSPLARRVQSDATRRRQFEREMMLDSLAWAPRTIINSRALGWSLVTIMLCAALLGLMAVGK